MNSDEKLSRVDVVAWLPTKYAETKSKSSALLARIKTAVGKETAAFIMEQPNDPENVQFCLGE